MDDGNTVTAGPRDEPFRLRSYQAEMVEESLRNNIIVAMDTGSGKTHMCVCYISIFCLALPLIDYRALARTAAELETCQPDQVNIPFLKSQWPR
jgi:type I site-specific restriction endonuclease